MNVVNQRTGDDPVTATQVIWRLSLKELALDRRFTHQLLAGDALPLFGPYSRDRRRRRSPLLMDSDLFRITLDINGRSRASHRHNARYAGETAVSVLDPVLPLLLSGPAALRDFRKPAIEVSLSNPKQILHQKG